MQNHSNETLGTNRYRQTINNCKKEIDYIKEAINSFDLSTLQERKIIELQGLIFNKLHIETFNYDVPDDENEYCKHIGYVLLNRLEEELSKRSLDKEKDFARTKTQN